MKLSSTWRDVPLKVKWTGLLWLFLSVGAIVSTLHSLVVYVMLPVNAMIAPSIVAIETGLEISLDGLILFASWRFLWGASWGRLVLEVATWLALAGYVAFGIIWGGAAVVNWTGFKQDVAAELPGLRPEIKLALGIMMVVLVCAACVVMIRALRSAVARNYTRSAIRA